MSMIILLKIQKDSGLSQDISDRRGSSFRLTSFLSESGSKMSSYNEVDFVNWTRRDNLWDFKQLWKETFTVENLETLLLESS